MWLDSPEVAVVSMKSTKMAHKTLLKDYVAFNVWANTLMVNWLKAQPTALLSQEVPSSFPTIRLTLLHMLVVEESWLHDLQGLPSGDSLYDSYDGPIPELFNILLEKSAEFADYVSAMSETAMQEICEYPRYDGTMERRPKLEIIHHCMNHSTFHRGQLVSMAHILGLSNPPQTDFMAYIWTLNI